MANGNSPNLCSFFELENKFLYSNNINNNINNNNLNNNINNNLNINSNNLNNLNNNINNNNNNLNINNNVNNNNNNLNNNLNNNNIKLNIIKKEEIKMKKKTLFQFEFQEKNLKFYLGVTKGVKSFDYSSFQPIRFHFFGVDILHLLSLPSQPHVLFFLFFFIF